MIRHRWQFWASVLILIGAFFGLNYLSRGEATPSKKSLTEIPLVIGDWTGREEGLEERVIQVLGVEDSIVRTYVNEKGSQAGLYVGYYESQGKGDTIHSPKHCLPGSGWHPVESEVTEITLSSGARIKSNWYLIQKGLDRLLVFYWYQERGRIITNEYWAKFYLIFDAITKNRTDGALVRITIPVRNSVDEAYDDGVEFVQQIFPHLKEVLPN